jgi:predicted permease
MWSVFLLAFKGMARVLLVCGAGVYLQKTGILTSSVRKAISKMVVNLLLPCLLFTRIVNTMDVDQLSVLLWLSLANLTYVTLGAMIGTVAVCVTRPARGLRNILAAAPALGHANSIPLLLVPHLCSMYSEKFGPDDHVTAEAYIGLYLITHTFTCWGIGLNVIRKPKESTEHHPEARSSKDSPPVVIGKVNGDSNASSAEAACNKDVADDVISPEQISLDDLVSCASETWSEAVSSMETGAPPPKPKRRRSSCRPPSCSHMVPEWLNRPMVACILALIVGLAPPLKASFVEEQGYLNVPFAAMQKLASAAPVIGLLGVGASFVGDGLPPISVIGYRPLAGLFIGRLLVLPALALLLWAALRRMQTPTFPQDPVFMAVVSIESCMPCAFNIVTMCTLQGIGERELSGALFYQYLVAMLTITGWTAVILQYVI